MMVHHEGTKDTKGTKERGLVVSQAVIGAAIDVHRELGPGLLESIYEEALAWELRERRLRVDRQVCARLDYKGHHLDGQIRLDMVVDNALVVEVKPVDRLHPIHRAQLLSYLRLTGYQVGLLLNFNTELLKHGMRRLLNG
jgi:GxxExxY protein